jgi:hypothetical protein
LLYRFLDNDTDRFLRKPDAESALKRAHMHLAARGESRLSVSHGQ